MTARIVMPLAAAVAVAFVACQGREPDPGALPLVAGGALRPYAAPPSVRTYPATEARINGWIYGGMEDSIRAHGWDLWESITSEAFAPGVPVWETWYSGAEIFVYERLPGEEERLAFRDFEAPSQFHHSVAGPGGIPFDPAEEVTSFNRFTESTARYIWENRLNDSTVLADTLARLLAADVPLEEVQVLASADSVDPTSIVLKPVFQFIRGDSATLVPYWVRRYTSVDTLNPTARSWTQGAWLDPTGVMTPGDSVPGTLRSGVSGTWPVVPLEDFYHIVLTAEDSAAFSRYAAISGDDIGMGDSTSVDSIMAMIRPGNLAVLMAMHLTTKEIPKWTWHTYWWAMDPADERFGADRPASIPPPWDHYNMNAAYSMVVDPVDAPGGTKNVVWNPYLESNLAGFFRDTLNAADSLPWYGFETNCMSCHRMATFPPPGTLGPGYRPASLIEPGDSIFAGYLKTDFLWSVAGRFGRGPASR